MTFVIVMGFHQIIVVMNDVKWHTYIKAICVAKTACLAAFPLHLPFKYFCPVEQSELCVFKINRGKRFNL